MELLQISKNYLPISNDSNSSAFIKANTIQMDTFEMSNDHIIPVFVKDNEPLISHSDFISCTEEVLRLVFPNEVILKPSIRVSHPIKGRIPTAKQKAAKDLLPHEKTLYYERMAFLIEVPNISSNVGGNTLSLTVGGIKAYNLDNLYARKGSTETFKVFIGFKNQVCCNMCISTDGLKANIKARSIDDLRKQLYNLFTRYQLEVHLTGMRQLLQNGLNEHQFVTLLGRLKLLQYLEDKEKKNYPIVMFKENQLSIVAKEYLFSPDFSRESNGGISLWNLFNLFTEANKASYIDSFCDRGSNAYDIANHLNSKLDSGEKSWLLS